MVNYTDGNLTLKELLDNKKYFYYSSGDGYCDGYEVIKNGDYLLWKSFWLRDNDEIDYEEVKGSGVNYIQTIYIRTDFYNISEYYIGSNINELTLDDYYEMMKEGYERAALLSNQFPVGYEDSIYVLNGNNERII